MAVKRNLTSPTDPVKGGSKRGKKAAPAAAAPAPAAKKPRAPKAAAAAAAPAAKKPKAEKTQAEQKFDNERAKHLKGERAKKKGKSIEKRLKERLAKYQRGLKVTERSQAAVRKLLLRRQAVAKANLTIKQKAGYTNLLAKQSARMDARKARKPEIQNGKLVTPKVEPKKVKLIKPKLKPMPRLKKGKEVTTPVVEHVGTAAQKAGAKKAAKTKAKGTVTV